MHFDSGFEDDKWRCSCVVESQFRGSLVDRIAGDGEDPVKEVDTLVVEWVVLVFDVAKELDGVHKTDGMGSNLVCVQLYAIPEGCKVLTVEQEVR